MSRLHIRLSITVPLMHSEGVVRSCDGQAGVGAGHVDHCSSLSFPVKIGGAFLVATWEGVVGGNNAAQRDLELAEGLAQSAWLVGIRHGKE